MIRGKNPSRFGAIVVKKSSNKNRAEELKKENHDMLADLRKPMTPAEIKLRGTLHSLRNKALLASKERDPKAEEKWISYWQHCLASGHYFENGQARKLNDFMRNHLTKAIKSSSERLEKTQK